jgi:hypothetical protein
MAHRLESPKHPPRRANPNAAAPRGQFTVSYRVLPFSGRTAVSGLRPKITRRIDFSGSGKSWSGLCGLPQSITACVKKVLL